MEGPTKTAEENALRACAFTGHRRIPTVAVRPLSELLLRGIDYLYQNGVRTFFAGGALGFDTLAAEAVLSYRKTHPGVRLVLWLPHRGQSERWSTEAILRYRKILAAADSVSYVSDFYYPGVMAVRNRRLIENADACIAYLTEATGGTAGTVALARKKGIPVYNLADRVGRG